MESVYEEIDDIALQEPAQHPNISNTNEELSSNFSSSSDKSDISTTEEQYLNPYQIIIPSIEYRPYSVIERDVKEIRNISCKTESVTKEKYEKELDEQEEHTVFTNVLLYPLNYSEVEFNTTDICNTEIASKQATTNPCSEEKTEYLEIVHNV
ncbi:uncharacterized protein LOC134697918 [Mytilus trossulus]|uniref:uncharacterized protein LOC134697918 n=1 Tax=Mytilus trossulus TaxID=6551 RepID=UPI00300623EB